MTRRARMAVADIPPIGDLLSPSQVFSLEMEMKTAAYFLDLGLASLEEILDEKHDFYPAPLQFLASGIEHLLKTTLSVGTLQVEGRLPTVRRLQKVVGHDLRSLRDLTIVTSMMPPLGSSEVGEGLTLGGHVLVASPFIEKLLDILSDYGSRNRYFYLDELLQPDASRTDPFAAFRSWLNDDASEASWDLYDETEQAEFSPLMEHILADRPGAFRTDRKRVVFFHLIGFIATACMFCVWFRGDGKEGALSPFVRTRTLLRPPRPWYVRRTTPPRSG